MRTLRLSALLLTILAGCGPAPDGSNASSPNSPVSSADPPGLFRDVARESGLDFRWGHGGKTPLNILETLGHGCAFLDYDGDGWLDIFLVGNSRCALFRNVAGGRFESVPPEESGLTEEGRFFGVAVGDYDNDGDPDVYVTGYGKCVLYRNKHGGSKKASAHTPIFEDVTARSGLAARHPYDVVTAAGFVDLDGDGRLDLFAGRYIIFTPKTREFCFYSGVKAGCGVKHYDPDRPRVYRNHGDGTFRDVTKAWGFDKASGRCLGVAVCATEDGRGVLLYAANDEVACDLFAPRGDRYENIGVPSATAFNRDGLTQGGMGTDWGDYDNDGRPDLIVATFQREVNSLYRSDGGEMFTEEAAAMGIAVRTALYVGWTARFFDYDNDGWLDLLFTNGHTQDNVHLTEKGSTYPQPTLLYHNEQGRQFADVTAQGGPPFQKPIVGRGAAFGDYDNDGRVDVVIVDEEGPVQLLHNEDRSGNRWLGVRLVGVRSNRDGIGARVRVTADGRTTVRDQQLCGGYISGHDPRLHFGLGRAARVERVEVRWPSGRVDTVKDVSPDRYIEITEGRGRTR